MLSLLHTVKPPKCHSLQIQILRLSQSSVVYKFICPGCSSSYIGKMKQTLHERT